MTWAAIFDFDGVIVNSEKQHEYCWKEIGKRRGKEVKREDFLRGFGLKNERFIREVLKWTDDLNEIEKIIHEKEAVFQDVAKRNPVELLPGVLPFVISLFKLSIPCAIGSSSIRKNIEVVLEGSPIFPLFKAIVAGEDVQNGKPNPEVFLTAATRVSVPPTRCVVFEDALLGVEAAKRAGMKTVAVTTTFDEELFRQSNYKPDAIVAHLGDLPVEVISDWFS